MLLQKRGKGIRRKRGETVLIIVMHPSHPSLQAAALCSSPFETTQNHHLFHGNRVKTISFKEARKERGKEAVDLKWSFQSSPLDVRNRNKETDTNPTKSKPFEAEEVTIRFAL